MKYVLMDRDGANVAGEFETIDEALRAVREDYDLCGYERTVTLALGPHWTNPDQSMAVISGPELIKLTLERFPEPISA